MIKKKGTQLMRTRNIAEGQEAQGSIATLAEMCVDKFHLQRKDSSLVIMGGDVLRQMGSGIHCVEREPNIGVCS